MTDKELIASLKRLKVQTGSLACMGCGREHNCGVHGCAILRETIAFVEKKLAGQVAAPDTKGDLLRRMTDRELAEELFNFRFDGYAKAQGAETVLPDSIREIEKWLEETTK